MKERGRADKIGGGLMTLRDGPSSGDIIIMDAGAVLALIAMVVELALGLYVLTRNPRSGVNQAFLILVLMVILLGAGTLVTSAADSENVARLGEQVATAGRFLSATVFVVFAILVTRNERWLKKWWAWPLLLVPAAVFIPIATATDLVIGPFTEKGKMLVPVGGPMLPAAQAAVGLLLLFGAVLVVRYWHREKVAVEKERAAFIVLAILVTLFGSFTTAVLFPQYSMATAVVSFIAGLLTISIIAYAVGRRGLMSTLPATMGKEIISMMKDPVLILDTVGKIEMANQATAQLTGYGREYLKGAELSLLFPDMAGDVFTRDASPERATNTTEQCHRIDGTTVPVDFVYSPIKRGYGGNLGTILVLHDLSEALKYARAEQRADIAAKEASLQRSHAEELSGIIDVAAHELLHPAAVLKGYANTLLHKSEQLSDETAQDALKSIEKAADRLTRLSVDLANASKIQYEGVRLAPGSDRLDSIVERVVGEMRRWGFENEIRFDRGFGQIQLRADIGKIEAVLLILLDNAVKFSPEGGAVEISVERGSRETILRVEDNGPGIPEEYRELVFEKFFQVEDAEHHSAPGLGLGLYLAKKIVDAHGGWIEVEPGGNGGSIFSFGIPDDIAL